MDPASPPGSGRRRYARSGHLLLSGPRGVRAAPFDPDRPRPTSPQTFVVDEVYSTLASADSWFSVSDTGTLAYVPGDPTLGTAGLGRAGRPDDTRLRRRGVARGPQPLPRRRDGSRSRIATTTSGRMDASPRDPGPPDPRRRGLERLPGLVAATARASCSRRTAAETGRSGPCPRPARRRDAAPRAARDPVPRLRGSRRDRPVRRAREGERGRPLTLSPDGAVKPFLVSPFSTIGASSRRTAARSRTSRTRRARRGLRAPVRRPGDAAPVSTEGGRAEVVARRARDLLPAGRRVPGRDGERRPAARWPSATRGGCSRRARPRAAARCRRGTRCRPTADASSSCSSTRARSPRRSTSSRTGSRS